jgi:hypothetical protein
MTTRLRGVTDDADEFTNSITFTASGNLLPPAPPAACPLPTAGRGH